MSLFAQMKLPPPDPFQTSGIPHSVQIQSAKRARLYLQKGSDQILKGMVRELCMRLAGPRRMKRQWIPP